MAQWYVKDLSRLTQISVQTLHHYDRIDLLKPSIRLANGYRLYSEKDLLRLQQIIALKYFGFELTQIKVLLAGEVNVLEHFSRQSQFLEDKARAMLATSHALKTLLSDCQRDESIPWETIIQLIEVYRMTQQLEKTWAGKALNQDELKQYADFEQSLKKRFTASEQKTSEQSWSEIVQQVNASLNMDPASDIGMALGKRCMDWVNNLYGRNYAGLRKTIWEKGFKAGHVGAEHNLSAESVAWLDKAMDAYYRNQIMQILSQVATLSHQSTLKQWEELLTEMYGDEFVLKQEVCHAAMNDDKISQSAKDWLKKYMSDVAASI